MFSKIIGTGITAALLSAAWLAPASANPPGLEFKPGNGGPINGNGARPGNGYQAGGLGGSGFRRQGGFGGGGQGFGGGNRQFGNGGGGNRQFGNNGGGYRRHGGGGYGAAVGAGVAGLAAGALIGGALANQQPYYGDPGYGGGYAPGYGYGAPTTYAAPVYADPQADEAEDAPQPAAGDPSEYCAGRYKSYDPSSGTFLGFDGLRHPCP